jgi:hypothetical protein
VYDWVFGVWCRIKSGSDLGFGVGLSFRLGLGLAPWLDSRFCPRQGLIRARARFSVVLRICLQHADGCSASGIDDSSSKGGGSSGASDENRWNSEEINRNQWHPKAIN